MDIMDILKEAEALQDEIAANRRVIHGYAELGFALPKTRTLVWNRLLEYGCSPCAVGKAGVCCDFGKQGPMVLLRADMDALPMKEQSGLPFAATNGNAHACGHDIHTAMLLAAAKLLKNHEDELQGRVRLMFQPAEEILGGAKDMIDHGVLDDVEAAFGLHVAVGAPLSRSGTISVPNGPGSNSADCYTVKVWGKSAHGSRPQEGVDAILIAVRIIEAFQMLLTTEVGMDEHCVLLVGTIKGGTSPNSIPGDAELGVTLRTDDEAVRSKMQRRIREVAESVAITFHGRAEVEHQMGAPGIRNDAALNTLARKTMIALFGEDQVCVQPKVAGEDFALVSERVPASFLGLGCGCPDEGYTSCVHQPDVIFNEAYFWKGTAALTACAFAWIEKNA